MNWAVVRDDAGMATFTSCTCWSCPLAISVAIATFRGTTRELRFESTVTLEHFESTLPEYPIEDSARSYPFRYSDEDFANLSQGLAVHYPSAEVASCTGSGT